jgi:hypothetical protein
MVLVPVPLEVVPNPAAKPPGLAASVLAAPPARTMSPPPVVAVPQVPEVVQISELLSNRITPPPETSLSDQMITSPPFVFIVWFALTEMLPRALSERSEPEVELVKPLTTVMSPKLSTRTLP